MIFSALTFSVAIPSAIKVWNWLATMYKGAIHLDTPMLYALAFIFLFTIGGLTGMFVGMVAVDIHLHDTYFVVAHFHYVMFGGTIMAYLGGLHYWWPKMTGKMYSEKGGRIAWLLIFVGFQITGRFRTRELVELIRQLPEGTTELMCHPGHCTDELRAARTRLKESREAELEALCAAEVRTAVEEAGVRVVSYRYFGNS
jgi:hypothetical protein